MKRTRLGRRPLFLSIERLEARMMLAAQIVVPPELPSFQPTPTGEALASTGTASHLDAAVLSASDKLGDIESIQWLDSAAQVKRGQWIVRIDRSSVTETTNPGLALADAASENPMDPREAKSFHPKPLRALSSSVLSTSYLYEFDYGMLRDATLDALSRTPGFQYAEPNFVLSKQAVPSDPLFGNLWGLDNLDDFDIDAPEAWDITTGSDEVVVGVIDSGVDYAHVDLADNIWVNPVECPGGIDACVSDGIDNDGNGYIDDFYGWDFLTDDNSPLDNAGHGTHVAGTIAAVGNNGIGATGVSWNSKILPLRFLNFQGNGSVSNAIEAVNYATMMKRDHDVNIRVTNNSWGGENFSQALMDAIQASGDEDILFVAAAGNDNTDNDLTAAYPASFELDNIISVASTTSLDARSSFSNYGLTSVDIAAPGSSIFSTLPDNEYGNHSGTSMASPHVAGVAALVFGLDPDATYTQVRNAILNSADPVPSLSSEVVSGGRLNARAAIEQVNLVAVAQSPAPKEFLDTPPNLFSVAFTQAVLTSSVNPSDLVVNGIPADSVTMPNEFTAEFSYDVSPVFDEGVHSMSISQGAISRATDELELSAFESPFYYDTVRLEPISITSGTTESTILFLQSNPTINVQWNEPIDPTSIDTKDLVIRAGGVEVGSVDFATQIDETTVQYTISAINTEVALTVTLRKDAVTDVSGIGTLTSITEFLVDLELVEYPADWTALSPLGSLGYESQLPATWHTPDDVDRYTFNITDGRVPNFVLRPDPADLSGELVGELRLLGPSGELLQTVSGTGTAEASPQALPLSSVSSQGPGTFTLEVHSIGAAIGTYELLSLIGEVVEDETVSGIVSESYSSTMEAGPSAHLVYGDVYRSSIRGELSSNDPVDRFAFPIPSQNRVAIRLEADELYQPNTIPRSPSITVRVLSGNNQTELVSFTTQWVGTTNGLITFGPFETIGHIDQLELPVGETFTVEVSSADTLNTQFPYRLTIYENAGVDFDWSSSFDTSAEANGSLPVDSIGDIRPIGQFRNMLGHLTSEASDFYRFVPKPGDSVVLNVVPTNLSPGLTTNTLQPQLDLYNGRGEWIASDSFGQINFDVRGVDEYTARVRGLTGTSGEYQMSFEGITFEPGPSLTTLSPVDEATDVGLAEPLMLTFDEPVSIGTGQVTIMQSDDGVVAETMVVSSGEVSDDGMTLTIQPSIKLSVSTNYHVLVDSGAVLNVDGIDFAGLFDPALWNFQTGVGHDFGDAPSPYPTSYSQVDSISQISRHIPSGPLLGFHRDTELDGNPSLSADGDDIAGATDDEDGLVATSLQVGSATGSITVQVSGVTSTAKLDAWIDFDGDGYWGGSSEQIADSISVVDGENVIKVQVPARATSGQAYLRMRLSTDGDLGFKGRTATGTDPDGEIEDHAVTILPPAITQAFLPDARRVGTDSDGDFVDAGGPLAAGDLDNDGDIDLFVQQGEDGKPAWLENDGTGQYEARPIPGLDSASTATIADLDGDGDLDIVSQSGNIFWLDNIGGGRFKPRMIIENDTPVDVIKIVDLSGDGDQDILLIYSRATSYYQDHHTRWYENDGNEAFEFAEKIVGLPGSKIDVVDLDRDGDLDFLYSPSNYSFFTHYGSIQWIENDGDNFHYHAIAFRSASILVAADLNGDSHMDFVARDTAGLGAYYNDGNQSFSRVAIGAPVNASGPVITVDLDGDGDLDIVASESTFDLGLAWYENLGGQTFKTHVLSTTFGPEAITAADVDGDADLDLVTMDSTEGLWVFENLAIDLPKIVSLSPASGRSGVATNPVLTMTFANPIVAGSGNLTIWDRVSGELVDAIDIMAPSVSIEGNLLTFTPSVTLDQSAQYEVRIEPGVIVDPQGFVFPGMEEGAWAFTIYTSGVDRGDYRAPVGSANDAVHTIVPDLLLGHTVDSDIENPGNPVANTDDTTGLDDEDGIDNPSVRLSLTAGTSPSVAVTVTNKTGEDATLFGWIDYDNDGVFGVDESASMLVADGEERSRLLLTFPVVPVGSFGEVGVRLRLGQDDTATQPTGASDAGEVEDYVASIYLPGLGTTTSGSKIDKSSIPSIGYGDALGVSVTSLGDIDGDGVSDIAVGAFGDDDGFTNAGAIYIVRLNADGSTKTSHKISSDLYDLSLASGSYFGSAMTSVGDIDNDGIVDLAVLSSSTTSGSDDVIHFISVNADGTLKSHSVVPIEIDAQSIKLASITFLGDLDGDGHDDLALGDVYSRSVHIMYGFTDQNVRRYSSISSGVNGMPLLASGTSFGSSVAAIGDINGDGVTDLAVGAKGDDNPTSSAGAVHVLLMNPDGTVLSNIRIGHPESSDLKAINYGYFGSSVAAIGDRNGDGTPDLLVGSMGYNGESVSETGRAYILFMASDGSPLDDAFIGGEQGSFPEISTYADFGASATAIGDVNGDGHIDVAIGASYDDSGNSSTGTVHLLFLSPPTMPIVDRVVVNENTAGRSRVDSVVVEFSEPVDHGLLLDAFTVINRDTQIEVGGVTVAVAPADPDQKTTATLTFAGSDHAGRSLADGNYELHIDANNVVSFYGVMLGGDGFTLGTDHVFGDEATDSFFRLYGDSTGDGSVGLGDFAFFRQAFGLTSEDSNFNTGLDADADGKIGLSDFAAIRTAFGNSR